MLGELFKTRVQKDIDNYKEVQDGLRRASHNPDRVDPQVMPMGLVGAMRSLSEPNAELNGEVANSASEHQQTIVSGEAFTEEAKPESLIDKHSSFNGLYRSTHNFRIQGVVDGEIDCQSTLIIDNEAKVRAKVVAKNVIVGGCLEGEVSCPGRFEILSTGRVVGKVVAGVLEIHDGAFYEGELSMQTQNQASLTSGANGGEPPISVAQNGYRIKNTEQVSNSDKTTSSKSPSDEPAS